MYSFNFNSMSTLVRISINHKLYANDLMPVYKIFTLVEDTCSRFKNNSELSQLNRNVGKKVKISSELFTILDQALTFYKETDGIFNPGILKYMENSGYNQSIEYIRGKDLKFEMEHGSTTTIAQPFELNEKGQSVILNTKIDLGGIAKGWVIDRAAELLTKYGYGFVNVGGDIRIFGSLPRPLNIGIEDPYDPSSILTGIEILTGGLATSTSMKRRWLVNGRNKHHLIDPFTGEPSQSTIISSTVAAPTAVEADVWAKVTLLLGEERGKAWIAKKGTKAVLINQTKEIWKEGEQNGNT